MITNWFGWLFLIIVFILDVFLIFLAFSRYGRFKLGSDEEEPEFSMLSWIGMLFSAGLGVGIVFWGVAEPLTHYLHSPFPGKLQITLKNQHVLRWDIHSSIGVFHNGQYLYFRINRCILSI